MITIGPKRPALMYERLSDRDEATRLEAVVVCAACREKHSGWCIAEMWRDPAACPLEEVVGAVAEESPAG